jgi:filamentous hemagglutinin family protein
MNNTISKNLKLKRHHKRFFPAFIAIFISLLVFTHFSFALPQDPTVQTGNVTINQPSAQQLNVIQSSDKAIIDWRSFNIQASEAVDFKLSSSNGLTLNRVTGDQASSILGSLKSNGRLVLINPNGVIFGDTARVDVRGLVATTTDISNWDFMNGNLDFNLPSTGSSGVVINKGDITVAEGGLVALVAPGVSNSGTINARLGKVSLVSGNTFTLDLYGDQLVNLAINDPIIKKVTGMYGQELDALVSNSGKIYADGGTVTLKVGTAQNALDQIINMDGIIQARSISTNTEGAIILNGGNKGTVNVSGQIDASGKWGQQKGGVVRISGKNVELRNGARVDVSANSGQGSAYIGGSANGDVQNSYRTALNMGSEVNADSLMGWGKGGKIVVKGTTKKSVYGTLSAKMGTIDIPTTNNTKITPKTTAVESKAKIKPESKKESKPKSSVNIFAKNTNRPAVDIGGVELAQNFNTRPSGARTFNGLGGVSTTSSNNSSPISSIRSETFTPPGQASQETPEQNSSNDNNPAENIDRANTPPSFSASDFLGIGGGALPVEIQSEPNNEVGDSQPGSATNLARSQRLRNL